MARIQGSVAALALAALAVCGCGSSATPSTGATSASAAGPVASARQAEPARRPQISVGGDDAPCPEPQPPDAFAQLYPASEPFPDPSGREVFHRYLTRSGPAQLDSDGDGALDEIAFSTAAGEPNRLRRSDGTLTFTNTGTGESPFPYGTPGDLDGDGRDEINVAVADPETGGPASTRILPGSTPPGDVDVSSLGVDMAGFVLSDRDLGGVATDQLLVVPGTGGPGFPAEGSSALLSRSAVARVFATGAGGEVEPEARVEGVALGWVDGASAPTLVTAAPGSTGDVVIRIGGRAGCRALSTAPHGVVTTSPLTPSILVGESGTDVVLRHTERGGTVGFLWRSSGWSPQAAGEKG